jgi:hypothetical protein
MELTNLQFGSIVPRGFQLSVFAPGVALVEYVKHAYRLGGYDIIQNASLAIDETGLEFVRTFNLRHREQGYEFRVINPEDYHVIFELHPTMQEIREYYGTPGACV